MRTQIALTVLSIAAPAWAASPQYDEQAAEPIAPLRGSLVLAGAGELDPAVHAAFVDLAGGPTARLVELNESNFDAEACATATGVWVGQAALGAKDEGSAKLSALLRDVLARGGVVAAGPQVAGRLGAQEGGYGLLPGALFDAYITTTEEIAAFQSKVGVLVGLRVDAGSAIVLEGRRLRVAGPGTGYAVLAATERAATRALTFSGRRTLDLVALSRAATARARPSFPPADPNPPGLTAGSLFIAGGGQLSDQLVQRFVDLCGGSDALILYVPCTQAEEIRNKPGMIARLQRAGAKDVRLFHTKDRRRADGDKEFLAPLTKASGVWFGGGRQWNLVDSYQHTTAHRLMHAVLARGGAIGGSSAGASIQASYMARGDPLGNRNIIAPGYEQGLGFLTGCAIDQHFSQRQRHGDMHKLVKTYPQLLGIGIDESTVLIVEGSVAEVVGSGRTYFFDRSGIAKDEKRNPQSLAAGGRYDLAARRVLE